MKNMLWIALVIVSFIIGEVTAYSQLNDYIMLSEVLYVSGQEDNLIMEQINIENEKEVMKVYKKITQVVPLEEDKALQYSIEINKNAKKHNIDPLIVASIIFVESRFNERAVGRAGELGLMQVLPSVWAKHYKVSYAELKNPKVNIWVGTDILSDNIKRCGGIRCGINRYNGCSNNSYYNKVMKAHRRFSNI